MHWTWWREKGEKWREERARERERKENKMRQNQKKRQRQNERKDKLNIEYFVLWRDVVFFWRKSWAFSINQCCQLWFYSNVVRKTPFYMDDTFHWFWMLFAKDELHMTHPDGTCSKLSAVYISKISFIQMFFCCSIFTIEIMWLFYYYYYLCVWGTPFFVLTSLRRCHISCLNKKKPYAW